MITFLPLDALLMSSFRQAQTGRELYLFPDTNSLGGRFSHGWWEDTKDPDYKIYGDSPKPEFTSALQGMGWWITRLCKSQNKAPGLQEGPREHTANSEHYLGKVALLPGPAAHYPPEP